MLPCYRRRSSPQEVFDEIPQPFFGSKQRTAHLPEIKSLPLPPFRIQIDAAFKKQAEMVVIDVLPPAKGFQSDIAF